MSFDPQAWVSNLTTTDWIAAAGFLLIATVVFLFVQAARRLGRDPLRERLALLAREAGGEIPEPRSSALTESLAAQLPQTKLDNGLLDRDLRGAGYYLPTARNEYLALRNSLVIGAVVMVGIVAVIAGPEYPNLTVRILVVGTAIAALCWALPRVYLRMQGRRRVRRIQKSLPDALDLVTMCLTGGLSLPDTLSHVSREIFFAHPDLAIELLIVREQADMTSLDLAFRQFSKRVEAPEILSMTTLIVQAQRLGTDVVASIRDYADSIRLKRRQLADETAGKAGIRLLFPLVLCLMPAAFILLWGPAALQLQNFFTNFTWPRPE